MELNKGALECVFKEDKDEYNDEGKCREGREAKEAGFRLCVIAMDECICTEARMYNQFEDRKIML